MCDTVMKVMWKWDDGDDHYEEVAAIISGTHRDAAHSSTARNNTC